MNSKVVQTNLKDYCVPENRVQTHFKKISDEQIEMMFREF